MGRDQQEASAGESSIGDCSSDSVDGPSTSSELAEDASSSSSLSTFGCSTSSFGSRSDLWVSSPAASDGPLYGLSELMVHLPIKRGLSKFYDGKSQSFTTSLAGARSIEDLAKEENPSKKRRKFSKGFQEDIDCRPRSPLHGSRSASARLKNASRAVASPFSPSSKSRKARSSFLGRHNCSRN
ncbi:hypothetical protein SAY86_022734 [Trapa natans]|uniref:Uncharacterized protein n=1 Tax=Trapa natans TaxID=22666 RepID=A0AAN7LW39_TRANT|nr:hypothetical protein SAY86_022734 [Trapa natans]